jgi:hypothetical protein
MRWRPVQSTAAESGGPLGDGEPPLVVSGSPPGDGEPPLGDSGSSLTVIDGDGEAESEGDGEAESEGDGDGLVMVDVSPEDSPGVVG